MIRKLVVVASAFVVLLVWGARVDAGEGDWQSGSQCLRQGLGQLQPQHASIAGAVPIYLLKPYNLHLSVAGSATGQLHVYDSDGLEVDTDLTFYGYDTSLISVSATGQVTALRSENSDEIGTWVHAAVAGQGVQNATVVRVLSTDYGIDFTERIGTHSVIYSPLEVAGENLDQYVEQYEMLTALDYAYEIQQDLIDTVPFQGARQVFEVDFGESENGRVCGISGNPVRLGWNLNGSEWSNCFLVPFIPPRSPQWFVITHELGHNTSWSSGVFGSSIGPNWVYSEAIASYLSVVAMRRMVEQPTDYPIGQPAVDSLEMDRSGYENAFMATYTQWLNQGAPFGELDPNIVDAILLIHASPDPDGFADRFFSMLKPQAQVLLQPVLDQITSMARRHTFFAAACSAAAEQDLYDVFLNTYDYPLDASFYSDALLVLENLPPPGAVFFDGFESGDTLAWSGAAGEDCPIQLDVNFEGASVTACEVVINGVVLTQPACPTITRVQWQWGDGAQTDSWFPASHTYSSSGIFSVTTTAFDAHGGSESEIGFVQLDSCPSP